MISIFIKPVSLLNQFSFKRKKLSQSGLVFFIFCWLLPQLSLSIDPSPNLAAERPALAPDIAQALEPSNGLAFNRDQGFVVDHFLHLNATNYIIDQPSLQTARTQLGDDEIDYYPRLFTTKLRLGFSDNYTTKTKLAVDFNWLSLYPARNLSLQDIFLSQVKNEFRPQARARQRNNAANILQAEINYGLSLGSYKGRYAPSLIDQNSALVLGDIPPRWHFDWSDSACLPEAGEASETLWFCSLEDNNSIDGVGVNTDKVEDEGCELEFYPHRSPYYWKCKINTRRLKSASESGHHSDIFFDNQQQLE